MDCSDEIQFIAKSLNRMIFFFFKTFEKIHDCLGCNKPKCMAKAYLNTTFYFVFDEQLTFKKRQSRFIDVSLTYPLMFKTFFLIQQSDLNAKFGVISDETMY